MPWWLYKPNNINNLLQSPTFSRHHSLSSWHAMHYTIVADTCKNESRVRKLKQPTCVSSNSWIAKARSDGENLTSAKKHSKNISKNICKISAKVPFSRLACFVSQQTKENNNGSTSTQCVHHVRNHISEKPADKMLISSLQYQDCTNQFKCQEFTKLYAINMTYQYWCSNFSVMYVWMIKRQLLSPG